MDPSVFKANASRNYLEREIYRQLADKRLRAKITVVSDLDGRDWWEYLQDGPTLHDVLYDKARYDAAMMRGHWIHLPGNNVGHGWTFRSIAEALTKYYHRRNGFKCVPNHHSTV